MPHHVWPGPSPACAQASLNTRSGTGGGRSPVSSRISSELGIALKSPARTTGKPSGSCSAAASSHSVRTCPWRISLNGNRCSRVRADDGNLADAGIGVSDACHNGAAMTRPVADCQRVGTGTQDRRAAEDGVGEREPAAAKARMMSDVHAESLREHVGLVVAVSFGPNFLAARGCSGANASSVAMMAS